MVEETDFIECIKQNEFSHTFEYTGYLKTFWNASQVFNIHE